MSFTISSCKLSVISCKILIITVITYETINELIIRLMLFRNVIQCYLEVLTSLFPRTGKIDSLQKCKTKRFEYICSEWSTVMPKTLFSLNTVFCILDIFSIYQYITHTLKVPQNRNMNAKFQDLRLT